MTGEAEFMKGEDETKNVLKIESQNRSNTCCCW